MDINGKTALVTGASGALGSAIVADLLAHGAGHVVALDLRKPSSGERLTALECDVSKPEQIALCLEKLPAIDILINNAGILHSAPLVNLVGDNPTAVDDWQRVIDVNLSSVFYVTRIVAQTMAKARIKGVIINMSSVSANGNPGQGAYSASKAGVTALTHVWAKELGPLGIRSIAIAPGYIDTESTRKAVSETQLKDIASRVPLKKLGAPEAILQAIRFAIENDYLNGTVLEVDGGLVV